ncbi:hypothetical protein KX935_06590 [Streptobacillus moniliformis]|nr:hypothetical protein KX935_06590 [Streptobacillus moniliformis]
MKSYYMFVITLGTIAIATYPLNNQLINLLMGLTLVVIGIIFLIRGNKK